MTQTDTRSARRHGNAQGLVIEGSARRIGPSAASAERAEPGTLLDLAQRSGARAYESLLDDAMRLAERYRGAGTPARAAFSAS